MTDQTTAERIENRMQDCGDGRHVGWWSEDVLGPKHLLIEVKDSVIFACCEGQHANTRIHFITSRAKGEAICRALASALGIALTGVAT